MLSVTTVACVLFGHPSTSKIIELLESKQLKNRQQMNEGAMGELHWGGGRG